MKITMKTSLALLLVLLPVATSHAAESTSAKALAEQIGHIVHSHTLTLKEKDDQISAAVRDAVRAAIANLTDPAEILQATEALTTVAAQAAPKFTHAILVGVDTIPTITSISGALGQIQTANVSAAASAATALIDPGSAKEKKDDDDGDGDDNKPDGDHDKDDISPSH